MADQVQKSQKKWPIGFRINERVQGPSAEWLERFRNIPTSWVSDSMGRSVGTIGLNTYHNNVNLMMCAPAYTVRVRPGDNLMIHKAIELAEKGDVIVIDGAGDISQSLIGGNIQATALFRGLAGFVIDGAIRDLADWASGALPIWAKGHTHRGPSKDGPGEINVPIVCAGMAVNPGDLVIGDADGVLAIPCAELESLWPHVQKQMEKEAHLKKVNANGTADPERFNSILRAKGCPI